MNPPAALNNRLLLPPRWRGLALALLALAFTLLRAGPLHGSSAALLLAVLGQLYLPGWLLARALGRGAEPHPILRLAWTLAAGLGLAIVLGGVCRLLNVPAPTYLLALHGLTFGLALLPAGAPAPSAPWRLSRRALPLYLAVVAAAGLALWVSEQMAYRGVGFEDPPLHISIIDWLATKPGEFPGGEPPLRSRQIGVVMGGRGDTRFDTDGWSYMLAAWVWASGVSASHLIWFDLNRLFVWTTPLLAFALAYTLTQREEAGAWTAIAAVIAGLLTLDNQVYNPSYAAYGRYAIFQVNHSWRMFAIAVMLPLALLVGLAWLRDFRRQDFLLMLLTGLTLAVLHPAIALVYQISLAAAAGLRGLARPSWAHLRRLAPLAFVLVCVAALPFIQRLNRYGLEAARDNRAPALEEPVEAPLARGAFLALPPLPVVGSTFIRSPATVFYHPVIALAAAVGLAFAVGWRRSLAAQYVFGATAALLVIDFTPGVTALVNRLVSSLALYLLVFMLPVALSLGLAVEAIAARLTPRPAVRAWGAAAVFLAAAGLLLLEPIPIPRSARDQIQAVNLVRGEEYAGPVHDALIALLRRALPNAETRVVMAPGSASSLILQEVPGALVTGWLRNRNIAHEGDARFYGGGERPAPWLDAADLAFMRQFGVTHIVIEADSTRLPQLLMQPERFQPLGSAAGYTLFAVSPNLEPDAADRLFEQMNERYGALASPPSREGFKLAFPGDRAEWAPLAAAWLRRLEGDFGDARARFGLAFSSLMAGDYATALPLLEALAAAQPAAVYAETAARARHLARLETPAAPLLRALDGADPAGRVLAARALLTGDFFYQVDAARLDAILALPQAEPLLWAQFMTLGQMDGIRRRAALLAYAGRYAAAEAWLDDLWGSRVSPDDLLMRAMLRLAQGDEPGALAVLELAGDPDRWAAAAMIHRDRWANNTAWQAYWLLRGERARRDGDLAGAEAGFRRAIEAGSPAGAYFLAELLAAQGRQAEADAARAAYADARDAAEPAPALASLLDLAGSGSAFVAPPRLERDDEQTLIVETAFGWPLPAGLTYPVAIWQAAVIAADDGAVIAADELPAQRAAGALARARFHLTLPDDLPTLTPALIHLQARHNPAVVAPPLIVPVTLNRPPSAAIPAAAQPVGRRFGEAIMLEAYTAERTPDGLAVTLFWRAEPPPMADYQVFLHLVAPDGMIIAQADGMPAGHYPTSQWRPGAVVADRRLLRPPTPPAPGEYTVRVGLYRLDDLARLPVTPAADDVADDSLRLLAAQWGE